MNACIPFKAEVVKVLPSICGRQMCKHDTTDGFFLSLDTVAVSCPKKKKTVLKGKFRGNKATCC